MSEIAPQFNASLITDHLIVGGGIAGEAELDLLKQVGVTHLISAAAGLDDAPLARPRGFGTYYVEWQDDGQAKPAQDFIDALAWVLEQQAQAMKVGQQIGLMVHCAAGINRGPLLATFLLAGLAGVSGDAAWGLIKAGRPQVHGFEVPAYRTSCQYALNGIHPFSAAALKLPTLAPQAGDQEDAAHANPADQQQEEAAVVAVGVADTATGRTTGRSSK